MFIAHFNIRHSFPTITAVWFYCIDICIISSRTCTFLQSEQVYITRGHIADIATGQWNWIIKTATCGSCSCTTWGCNGAKPTVTINQELKSNHCQIIKFHRIRFLQCMKHACVQTIVSHFTEMQLMELNN